MNLGWVGGGGRHGVGEDEKYTKQEGLVRKHDTIRHEMIWKGLATDCLRTVDRGLEFERQVVT